jgi:8-oxo-dGTP diphosphatase
MIYKIAPAIIEDKRLLLCRKRGLNELILPGGKIEADETPEACLQRECQEELGPVSLHDISFLATYEAPAAGKPARLLRIDLYTARLEGTPLPHSEIEEILWYRLGTPHLLSPILETEILPDLIRRGLLH